jgi:hypothetical protein
VEEKRLQEEELKKIREAIEVQREQERNLRRLAEERKMEFEEERNEPIAVEFADADELHRWIIKKDGMCEETIERMVRDRARRSRWENLFKSKRKNPAAGIYSYRRYPER